MGPRSPPTHHKRAQREYSTRPDFAYPVLGRSIRGGVHGQRDGHRALVEEIEVLVALRDRRWASAEGVGLVIDDRIGHADNHVTVIYDGGELSDAVYLTREAFSGQQVASRGRQSGDQRLIRGIGSVVIIGHQRLLTASTPCTKRSMRRRCPSGFASACALHSSAG